MSDQPHREPVRQPPDQPPSRIIEEPPLPQPDDSSGRDDWDDDPDEDQDNPVQQAWDGKGWPGPELFWP